MRRRAPFSRTARATLLGGTVLALLAGCEPGQFGYSGREAEWARTHGAFSVVSATAQRAVLSAEGNRIAVEPPPGFCLADDEIETSDRSAFVLIGDCVMDAGQPGVMPPAGDGALDLPPGMPGIITVALSGDPGFARRGASDRDLSQLEAYLETPEGRALLGRGGDGSQVSVIDTQRRGDSLYVLVEDRDGAAVPVLAPRFWRAFVELNDRLAVVTVSGFRDLPMDEDEMLRHLGDQVRQLQLANALPIEEAPVQVAGAEPRPRPPRAETGSGDEPSEDAELDAAEDFTRDVTTVGTPARGDAGWDALAAASEAGEAPEDAAGAPDSGWEELASEAAGPSGEEGPVGGPEPGEEGWSALAPAANGAVPGEDATAAPAEPLVVASTRPGGQGPWPMPSKRPGAADAWQTTATAPAAAASVPMPPPRLAKRAGSAAGQSFAPVEAVPLPPQRKRP